MRVARQGGTDAAARTGEATVAAMSVVVAFWYTDRPLRREEAAAVFERLMEGDATAAPESVAVDTFRAELLGRFGRWADRADEAADDYPFASEIEGVPGRFVSFTVSGATPLAVYREVQETADRYGLVEYAAAGGFRLPARFAPPSLPARRPRWWERWRRVRAVSK